MRQEKANLHVGVSPGGRLYLSLFCKLCNFVQRNMERLYRPRNLRDGEPAVH